MFSQDFISALVRGLVHYGSEVLFPIMIASFFMGVVMRSLIYYTIWREMFFAKEFDKRVNTFLETVTRDMRLSFYLISKKLLEKTFYELFVVRAIMKRRNPDVIMTMSDRIFLTKQGAAWIVHDLLKQIRHLKHDRESKMLQITKSTLQNNPCFNRVFGVIPASMFNDLVNILPGILIVGGIFGTFLGIMSALPELGQMDLSNIEETKMVMDRFLENTSFAMSTSLVGILLSVTLSIFNSMFSPEKLFVRIVDRLESALEKIWSRSDHNDLPRNLSEFDEHRDPLEALAEEALHQELGTHSPSTNKRKDGPPEQSRDAS